MENLRVTLSVLFLVNQQLAGDHGQDIAIRRGGLSIQSGDSVSHFLEGQGHQLLDNVLGALELRSLERQHRLVSVQVAQLVSVGVELLVVEVAELGGDGGEIDCG